MSLSGLFNYELTANVSASPATGVGGGGAIQFGELLRGRRSAGYGFGVGAGRWNRAYYYCSRHTGNTALSGTTARSLDLQTQVDQYGVAIGLEEVVWFGFIADPENTININLTPNATNGWTALFAAAGDIGTMLPGARLVLDAMGRDVGYTVDATHKVLDIVNATSGTGNYELMIIGRSTA